MAVFNFITDDSHGWMEVDLTEYPEAKNYATGFGYINGNLIYLEEDDEAENFIVHLMSMGETPTFNEKNYNGQWYGRAYARNTPGIHAQVDGAELVALVEESLTRLMTDD